MKFIVPAIAMALIPSTFAQIKTANLEIQLGHSVGVSSVEFSADDRLVLTLGTDGQACLWDSTSGKELRRFPDTRVRRAGFSPDGSEILLSTGAGVVLRSASTGGELRRFGGNQAGSGVFSHDGALVAATVGDSVLFWDAESGKQVKVLHDPAWVGPDSNDPKRPSRTPVTVGFAHDHPWLLSCDQTGEVALWDHITGDVIRKFVIGNPLRGCWISPDDQIVVVAAGKGERPSEGVSLEAFLVSSGVRQWSNESDGRIASLRLFFGLQKCRICNISSARNKVEHSHYKIRIWCSRQRI